MKIVTYNIWDVPFLAARSRQIRINAIANYLKHSQADIICIQESFNTRHRKILQDELVKTGYFSSDPEIKKRRILKDMFDTTGGLIVFSKFPILQERFVRFANVLITAPEELLGRKGMLICEVKTPGGSLYVLTTHLHRNSAFRQNKVRLRQLEYILNAIDHDREAASIFAGDFNQHDIPTSHAFYSILSRHGFTYPQISRQIRPTYRRENMYAHPFARSREYDYVFVKNLNKLGLKVHDYAPDYLPVPLSDHDPVHLTARATDFDY